MYGLDVIHARNNQATERELLDAIEADDLGLAFRIADAIISDALAKGVDASWPGYTPEAQTYELATRVGCDPDGIAHLLPRADTRETRLTMLAVLDCGHEPSEHSEHTTGYGIDRKGKKHCYACCARMDRESMIRDGKTVLYLTGSTLSNWPGSLNFTVGRVRVGRHNIAGKRFDVWFTGPDSKEWHGVQYGENTQLCHCKRIKS